MNTEKKVRSLVSRAIRACAEDGKLGSFKQQEKTIIDNMDFLYWLIQLAELDEREACAKQLDALGCDHCAAAIRARGEK